jgi:transaldolase
VKIFIDSAILDEIKQAREWGLLDGVTTNPSLLKKAADKLKGESIEVYLKKILEIAKGVPVSLEVVGADYEEMVKEGKSLYKKFNGVAKNVFVKIPVNPCLEEKCDKNADGIKAIRALTKLRIPVNCTLIFTPEQALLAARAGAKFVSPFVGRVDDYIREMNRVKFEKTDHYPPGGLRNAHKVFNDRGIVSGVDLIAKTRKIFDNYKIKSEILAASIRNVQQFREVALAGTDIATLPFAVIEKLLKHHKSAEGMRKFTEDIVPEYAKIVGYTRRGKR